MKPDGTPTVDEILLLVDQLQEYEKRELVNRIFRGGISTIFGRYNYGYETYH